MAAPGVLQGGGTIQALTSQGASGVARHDDTYPSRLAAIASRPTVKNPDLETGPTVALPAMELELKVIDQRVRRERSEEHTSEFQSLMRNSYAVFCLKKKT